MVGINKKASQNERFICTQETGYNFLKKVKNKWIKMPITKCFSLLLLMSIIFLSLHNFGGFNWLSFHNLKNVRKCQALLLELRNKLLFYSVEKFINSEYHKAFSLQKNVTLLQPDCRSTQGKKYTGCFQRQPTQTIVVILIFYFVPDFLTLLFFLELIIMLWCL